jgi:hypothetical protein
MLDMFGLIDHIHDACGWGNETRFRCDTSKLNDEFVHGNDLQEV